MHYFIYPSQDATIYNNQGDSDSLIQNTGLDAIIQVDKFANQDGTIDIARGLIQFDITQISQSIVDGTITGTPDYYLNLKISEANEIPLDYTIFAHAVSQSWEMGIGTLYDSPIDTEGVSWTYRDSEDIGTIWSTGSFAADTTGSLIGGGTYYTSSLNMASQSFSYETSDVRMNITNIVNQWLSGSTDNNGIILKHSDVVETTSGSQGSLKFFSTETNTIFSPTLELVWVDQTYSTGSLDPLFDSGVDDVQVKISNLRDEYKEGSKVKFNVVGRERYPTKTFANAGTRFTVSDVKYLPQNTFYSISDTEHDNIIVPFDSGSLVSNDGVTNYFNLWMNSFQPERFYKIVFKVERNGLVEYYDGDHVFKVVK